MISGNYCDTFAEATHGMPDGISLNAPYKFHWVKVVRVEGETLHCTGGGEPFALPIKKLRHGTRDNWRKREYVEITIPDPIFGPQKFKVLPFKGEEF